MPKLHARKRPLLVALSTTLLAACGGSTTPVDAIADVSADRAADIGTDANADTPRDVAAERASDVGTDANTDVVDIAPADTTTDTSTDADAGPDPYGIYNHDGSDTVTMFTASLTNGSSSFMLNVYVPGSSGTHPVVSLSPGLQQPAVAYRPYGQRLASHGIITLIRDDPGVFVNTTAVTADIVYTIATWLPAQNTSATSPLMGRVDLGHVGLAGHSRGGKGSLIAAEMGLHGTVHAWFGLDPVDSSSFSGGVQARTTLASVGIPTAFLGCSVSSSCSPAADNYLVLYALTPSPSVALTGVGAGHTQLEDPASCAVCGVCTPMGTAATSTVLAYAVRYLTAFFARELLGDTSVGPTFDGAGAPLDIAAGLITRMSR
jgi:hypothetical protein